MTLRQISKHIPGKGCKCHAHSDSDCGCDVDWTPTMVLFLEWKLARYSERVSQYFDSRDDTALRAFADILNEPLRGKDYKLNPSLKPWLDI